MVFFSPSFSLLENILFSFFLLYFSNFPSFFSFFFFSIIISFLLFLIRWPPLAQVSPPVILPGGLSFGLFLLSSAGGFVVLQSFRLSLLICSPCIVRVCFIQSFRLSFFAVFSLFGWVFLIFTRSFFSTQVVDCVRIAQPSALHSPQCLYS